MESSVPFNVGRADHLLPFISAILAKYFSTLFLSTWPSRELGVAYIEPLRFWNRLGGTLAASEILSADRPREYFPRRHWRAKGATERTPFITEPAISVHGWLAGFSCRGCAGRRLVVLLLLSWAFCVLHDVAFVSARYLLSRSGYENDGIESGTDHVSGPLRVR